MLTFLSPDYCGSMFVLHVKASPVQYGSGTGIEGPTAFILSTISK